MTKFMLQKVNLDMGIGNGCRRLVGKDVESLVKISILIDQLTLGGHECFTSIIRNFRKLWNFLL